MKHLVNKLEIANRSKTEKAMIVRFSHGGLATWALSLGSLSWWLTASLGFCKTLFGN